MKRVLSVCFIMFVLFCFSSPIHAAGEWKYDLTPMYIWGVSMDGDMTIMGQTAPVEADFRGIAENMEAVFTIHFEAAKGEWGYLLDYSYLKVGGQETLPIGATLDVDFTNVMAEGAVFYRMEDVETLVDLLVGLRYTLMDVDMEILGVSSKVSRDKDWTDLYLGVRTSHSMSEQWKIIGRADIGGFGISSSSDLTWNLALLLDYQPWKNVSIVGGYRIMDIDYSDGDIFVYNVRMSGPVLAVNFRW